jgi:hypothetical protein
VAQRIHGNARHFCKSADREHGWTPLMSIDELHDEVSP